MTSGRAVVDPDDPAVWRHLFDCCDECSAEEAGIHLPIAHLDDQCFLYQCNRGHTWVCWWNVQTMEALRFTDCPCDDCTAYTSETSDA